MVSPRLAIAPVVFVFLGNVVFENFARLDFGFVGIGRGFNGVDEFGFEGLAFLSEFLDAFGVGAGRVRKPFNIARLAARTGPGAWANRQSDFPGGGASASAGYLSAARGLLATSGLFRVGCFLSWSGCLSVGSFLGGRLFLLGGLGFFCPRGLASWHELSLAPGGCRRKEEPHPSRKCTRDGAQKARCCDAKRRARISGRDRDNSPSRSSRCRAR